MTCASAARSVLLAACLTGCTIAPAPVTPAVPAWDVNGQTSGIVDRVWLPDGGGPEGFLVTPAYVARYNARAERFGARFTPALKPGDGLQARGGCFLIDAQHAQAMARMARMEHSTP